jgi:hypothetical protein
MAAPEINYKADGKVVQKFLRDWPYASLIRGPVGSGKSAALVIKILMAAMRQKPSPVDGVRYTRFAVVRRTNPQLKTTTIKTWLQWVPEHGSHGVFRWSPPYTHHLRFKSGDGSIVDCEVIFMALDRPGDMDKLLSLELTGIVFNEAREIEKSIIDTATSRVGRYPAIKDGGCDPWFGILLDTNAPDSDHWWPIMAGDVPPPNWLTEEEKRTLIKPEGWVFYEQPPAMIEEKDEKGNFKRYIPNPERENKVGVSDDYYLKAIQGKSKDWIDIYILNKYGTLASGKPVYPTFKKDVHVAREEIEPDPSVNSIIGLDFGRTPCAVFMHQLADDRLVIYHEFQCRDMGAEAFAHSLTREIVKLGLDDKHLTFVGDPSGDYMGQSDDKTPFRILNSAGIPVVAASTNDPIVRIGAVEHCLNTLINGHPIITISPNCKQLIAGFEAGYMFKKKNTSEVQYEDKPYKNRFSHLHDALQYAALKAGFGVKIMSGAMAVARSGSVRRPTSWNPFGRRGALRK